MRLIVLFLASGGFLGYIPIVPGTFGTLPGVPLFWVFDALRSISPILSVAAYVLLVLGAIWVAGRADHLLGEHDSRIIVIDEIAGYAAATLFLEPSALTATIAFVAFRVFDVIKPFPAGWIDAKLPGGAGVVLDDVCAGLYANLATRLVLLFLA